MKDETVLEVDKMGEVFEAFHQVTGCPEYILKSKCRKPSFIYYRKVFINASHILQYPKVDIAEFIGYRDHTPVINLLQNVVLTQHEASVINSIVRYVIQKRSS